MTSNQLIKRSLMVTIYIYLWGIPYEPPNVLRVMSNFLLYLAGWIKNGAEERGKLCVCLFFSGCHSTTFDPSPCEFPGVYLKVRPGIPGVDLVMQRRLRSRI